MPRTDNPFFDDYFLEREGIHPMTSFFIGLPLKKTEPMPELHGTFTQFFSMRGMTGFNKKGVPYTSDLPFGMAARRTLLYLFSEQYQHRNDPNKIIRVDEYSTNKFLRKLGYSFNNTAMGRHAGNTEMRKFHICRFRDKSPQRSEHRRHYRLIREDQNQLIINALQLKSMLRGSASKAKEKDILAMYERNEIRGGKAAYQALWEVHVEQGRNAYFQETVKIFV